MQQRKRNAGTHGSNKRKQQRSPKVPTQALIEGT